MIQPPETVYTDSRRVSCDGATDIRAKGSYKPAALGHPRVWLEIDEKGFVECGYCDRRFVFKGAHDDRDVNELGAGDLYSEQPVDTGHGAVS
ncbi:MAG: zinc-finger domain-containing protein [Sphingomonadales bacterium]|nr:zinc-finger domain-containing protein [Sphingomonadales bacterium]